MNTLHTQKQTSTSVIENESSSSHFTLQHSTTEVRLNASR